MRCIGVRALRRRMDPGMRGMDGEDGILVRGESGALVVSVLELGLGKSSGGSRQFRLDTAGLSPPHHETFLPSV